MQKSQEQSNNSVKIPLNPPFTKGESLGFLPLERGDWMRTSATSKRDLKNSNRTIGTPRTLEQFRVALVHDFLIYPGGAEKVLEVLCEMFPEAPIYTLLYDSEKMRGKFKNREIRNSFLQKFPKFLRKRYRLLLPLMPTAPETFDLRDFDLVISSSGAWSKGIITRLNTVHIAYIHSPMRFVWDYHEQYIREVKSLKLKVQSFFIRFFGRLFLSYLRLWDYEAAQRPDYLVANSCYTQERIKKYYRRDSEVIYPPASNSLLPSGEGAHRADEGALQKEPSIPSSLPKGERGNGRYFLSVSRLSPYKKVDIVIEAFNKLELPLVIIGEGKKIKYYRKIAGKNVKILGWQSEEKLGEYYKNARAFIFPTEDDFGLTMVEAMNYGVPVIAYNGGGAREIVEEGKTGEFFDAQTVEVLADGVRKFMENEEKYDKDYIIKRAGEFGKARFKLEFMNYIESIINS